MRHSQPELIRLGVRPGVAPSAKPPVRIFLGTEASQFRPERVLVWSVEQVRDPARVYEIHLMKELAGFDRRGWTTGFTNYRFAIPHFAGAGGRAIYNDEDQIYLTDPAELFDLDMQGHGFLAISPRESSVMLIDCERMAKHWTLEAARRSSKKRILSCSLAVSGLWGPLDGGWNARDGEYRQGSSHLLHYTTLHTQPWRPFPERFVYQENPLAGLWHGLERSADEAGFQLFDRERPSARFRALQARGAKARGRSPGWARAAIADLLRRVGQAASHQLMEVFPTPTTQPCELGVVTSDLESVPEDDLAWVLDEIFGSTRRCVFAAVNARGHRPPGPTQVCEATDPARWPEHFEAAGRRHPDVSWELVVRGAEGDEMHRGGPFVGPGPPRVWVLEHPRDSEPASALALASALGWPSERRRAGQTRPPWPDLVLSEGPHAARAARRVLRESRGRVRSVQLGPESADDFDLVITPAAASLFAHPRRVETALPLVAARGREERGSTRALRERLVNVSAPLIGLLVQDVADVPAPAIARLVAMLSQLARESGGSLFVCADARVPARALAAARHVERSKGAPGRAALRELAEAADELHWAGSADELLAEVCAQGRPLTLHPLPRPRGWRGAGRKLVHQIALRGRRNDRGTLRPQQGLERLCARLIERGWVLPPRDPARGFEALIRAGAARLPAADAPNAVFQPLCDLDHVADRVRRLVGSA